MNNTTMVDIGAGIPSADAIASAFPHAQIERIHGTPSRVDIDDAQEKETENAASHPSTRGGGGHGHAGIVVPVARYVVEFSPTVYLWEANPGEAPVYPAGVAAAPQRILDNNFQRSFRVYIDQLATHTALKNQLYRRYDQEFWTGLLQPGTGISNVTLLEMYTNLYLNYEKITDGYLKDAR